MSSMVFTLDFSRPPESPIEHGSSQTMEQIICQLDCVLPLLFAEVRFCSCCYTSFNCYSSTYGHCSLVPRNATTLHAINTDVVLTSQVLVDPPGSHNIVKESFGHLRRFALAHMRAGSYHPGEDKLREDDLLAARDELLLFAMLAEQVKFI